MSTRDQHLTWCKDRARQCLDREDVDGAWLSFCADMAKHVETKDHPSLNMGTMLKLMTGGLSTVAETRDFINGFN